MVDFFKQLRDLMLNDEKENLPVLISYYETLWQHKDKIEDMVKEIESYPEITIQYIENKENYYSHGKLAIFLFNERDDWMTQTNFHYEIELLIEDRMWGYCECSPEDEGYVDEKECCGAGCDWYAPSFNARKIEQVASASFSGFERELWKLERRWDKYLAEHNKKIKEEKLQRLEEQLEQTKKEIELIKNSQ